MKRETALTPCQADYLKAIYRLHQGDSTIRLMNIADAMSVTKPSAFYAVSQLSEMGLIEHEKFGPVYLTPPGLETAQALAEKHEMIKRFLMRVLNVEEAVAQADACAMEHILCAATLAEMAVRALG